MYHFSIRTIKYANREAGGKFFTAGAMRFFNSYVHQKVFGGCYFVTSEQFDHRSPRLYTVRKISEDGRVSTVGDFQAFATAGDAYAMASSLAS